MPIELWAVWRMLDFASSRFLPVLSSAKLGTDKTGIEQVDTTGPRPRRGRPPKGGEGKRASFNTRIRDSLKQQLERAAADAGRSLSEEIEYRLERSFDERPLFSALELAYGPRIAGLLLLIGEVARDTEAISSEWEDLWREVLTTQQPPTLEQLNVSRVIAGQLFREPSYHHLREGVLALLDALAPTDETVPEDSMPTSELSPELAYAVQKFGEYRARSFCRRVADPEWAASILRKPHDLYITSVIRSMLGPELTGRIKSAIEKWPTPPRRPANWPKRPT